MSGQHPLDIAIRLTARHSVALDLRGHTRRGACTLALLAAAVCASPAYAQVTALPDPDAEATTRFGPLSMKSTIALSNLGSDSNVFNEADGDRQPSDFTVTFTPTTDLWLRLGRTWVSGTIGLDWIYYKRYATERAANSTYRVGVSRAVRRLALKGNFTRLSTRARPGFEIDARSQRQERLFDGEVTIRMFSRTHVGAKGWRREVEFDQAAVFREANLGEELNRRNSGAAFILRIDLTPLTSVALEMGRERDRYVSTPLRDADSTHVAGTVTFQPLALISGDASFGYRRFLPLSNEVPPYRGGTAAVNLTYAIFGTTRLGVGATRNIQPSFELSQPYFLETGVSGSVQQQIYGGFDILARTGLRWLEYRDRLGREGPGIQPDGPCTQFWPRRRVPSRAGQTHRLQR